MLLDISRPFAAPTGALIVAAALIQLLSQLLRLNTKEMASSSCLRQSVRPLIRVACVLASSILPLLAKIKVGDKAEIVVAGKCLRPSRPHGVASEQARPLPRQATFDTSSRLRSKSVAAAKRVVVSTSFLGLLRQTSRRAARPDALRTRVVSRLSC